VEGQGNDAIQSGAVDSGRQLLGAPIGNGQLVSVFQGVNNAVERKIVGEGSDGPVEMGRIFQAGAATLAVRGLVGAKRAARRGKRGQIGAAVEAKQVIRAVGATQQATAG
jgi:hypothetical protein